MSVLKADSSGRIRTPRAKQDEILRAFDESGASGVEFAKMVGVKYPTFAAWIRRRKRSKARQKPVAFVEAVVPSQTEELIIELPRSVRAQITHASQIPLVVELLRSLESC